MAPSNNAEAAMPNSTPGQRHADQPEETTERHHHGERHRQQPDRGRAQLRSPNAYGNHRENVVESGPRVPEPRHQSYGLAGRERARGPSSATTPASWRQPASWSSHFSLEHHHRSLHRPIRPPRRLQCRTEVRAPNAANASPTCGSCAVRNRITSTKTLGRSPRPR